MLGSEGEGLRWNLRSKADVDVYIRGDRGRGGVDSLNVSVAAGILCNAFVRVPRKMKTRAEKAIRTPEDAVESDLDDPEAQILKDMDQENGSKDAQGSSQEDTDKSARNTIF